MQLDLIKKNNPSRLFKITTLRLSNIYVEQLQGTFFIARFP